MQSSNRPETILQAAHELPGQGLALPGKADNRQEYQDTILAHKDCGYRYVSDTDTLALIGASTGGVDALVRILSVFDSDCPPTVIVQHTGRQFGESLVRLLRLRCKAQVVLCENDLAIERGKICVAAGLDSHAVLCDSRFRKIILSPGPPVNGHMPSIDKLFLSALPIARRVIASVLTGMGNDGAKGLLALRNAGAMTIAQDEQSSVVFGMPRQAWENGGAIQQLSISEIGPKIVNYSRARK